MKETLMETEQLLQEETLGRRPSVLLVLTGPTGAGKDAVKDKILQKYPEMKTVITVTSRRRRT